MRDKKRINRILKLLEEIWDKSPDQRFGQLLINIGIVNDDTRLWNNGDSGLEDYLTKYLAKENE